MLGVRRPTASGTARQLQTDGLLRYSRGKITITDGPGLERAACSRYRIIRAEFGLITGTGQPARALPARKPGIRRSRGCASPAPRPLAA